MTERPAGCLTSGCSGQAPDIHGSRSLREPQAVGLLLPDLPLSVIPRLIKCHDVTSV